jgi:hypothetical protein
VPDYDGFFFRLGEVLLKGLKFIAPDSECFDESDVGIYCKVGHSAKVIKNLVFLKMNRIFLPLAMVLLLSCQRHDRIDVWYDQTSSVLSYGVEKLGALIDISGLALEKDGAIGASKFSKFSKGLFVLTPSAPLNETLGEVLDRFLPGIEDDGYKIVWDGGALYVIGLTDRGCLYGLMDVAEQLGVEDNLSGVQ